MTATDTDADRVVTAFCRHRGEVLLLRRSDAVDTYPGFWGGVSGFAEDDPDAQVRVELREETGLDPDADLAFVRSGRPVAFEDAEIGREWVVHPYLFDVENDPPTVEGDQPTVELSEEHTAYEWVPPTAIATGEYDAVPKLWEAYERVAPTVRSIAADDEHGAATLSIRALEVLRDRAGLLIRERTDAGAAGRDGDADAGDAPLAAPADPDVERDELAELARRLLEARPSMAVLRNRVHRAMAEASDPDAVTNPEAAGEPDDSVPAADAVLAATLRGIDRALDADAAAAARASEFAAGRVLTLSRSGTVRDALLAGEPDRVFVAESRPAREGVGVAEALAGDLDRPVTLHTDAATAHVLSRESIDAVLVGADAILPDGRVVNKAGTRGAAIAAAHEGVPVYAVAASDKVSTTEDVNLESGDRSAVYAGDAPLDVANPTFDVTPADCVTGIVTERGLVDPGDVEAIAEELRELAGWPSEA